MLKMSTTNEEKVSTRKTSVFYQLCLVLVLVGALNWGTAAILGSGKDIVSVLSKMLADLIGNEQTADILPRVIFGVVAAAGIIVTLDVSSNGF